MIVLSLFHLFTFSPLLAQSQQSWRQRLDSLNREIDRQPESTDLRLKKAAVNIELGQWDYAV